MGCGQLVPYWRATSVNYLQLKIEKLKFKKLVSIRQRVSKSKRLKLLRTCRAHNWSIKSKKVNCWIRKLLLRKVVSAIGSGTRRRVRSSWIHKANRSMSRTHVWSRTNSGAKCRKCDQKFWLTRNIFTTCKMSATISGHIGAVRSASSMTWIFTSISIISSTSARKWCLNARLAMRSAFEVKLKANTYSMIACQIWKKNAMNMIKSKN